MMNKDDDPYKCSMMTVKGTMTVAIMTMTRTMAKQLQ